MGTTMSACIALTTSSGDGHHNPGTACLGCHNGGTAPNFAAAGTLYDAVSSGNAIAGATIEIIDGSGTATRVVTGANGNFYTTGPLTGSLTVRASGCPNDMHMTSSATGNCNSCHGATNQIHLP
jgi:hypothetical protein